MSGFEYVGSDAGGDVTGKLRRYHVDSGHSSILAPGDAVVLTGTADTDGTPEADAATAGADLLGIIHAVEPNLTGEALSDSGLPASTAGYILVNVDPYGLYEANVSNGPLVVANTGLNGNLVATAATKSGGVTRSNMTFNATGIATTATLQFRIVRLLTSSAGTFGGRVLVRINESSLRSGATGV